MFRQRINFRVVVFAGLVLFLLGTPIYIYCDAEINGGIRQLADRVEVDLKALGNFPFDPSSQPLVQIPARFRALDGKRVVVRGQVDPLTEAGDRISSFRIVYNRQICCFNGPPKVQECVIGNVPKGGTINLPRSSYADITGILHVQPSGEDGIVAQIYSIDVEEIKPAS